MGYFSKYLNRDMAEYQGPPSWGSDTDQYGKAHTVGLKTHKNSPLTFFRIDHVCSHAPVPDNETDSSDRGTSTRVSQK